MRYSAEIDLNTSALVLIEFQQEWLHPQGKLRHLFADEGQFLHSVKNAEQVLNAARQASMSIAHAGLHYSDDYKELGQSPYGLRAVIKQRQTFKASSRGSAFALPFVPLAGELWVGGRNGASAFAGSNLDSYLRNNHIKTLFLMGYALHVCVESTLRAAHDLGYETIIIEDACAAFTDQQKNYVLNEVVHHFGASTHAENFIHAIKKEK